MLLLLLLQVLASCLWLGRSEVVTSFQSCPQFFFQGTPPNDALKPNNPAWICQRYNNQYHFATLYNRDLRIPAYSAYLYQPEDVTKPGNIWMVEPQLIGPDYPKDMEKESTLMSHSNVTLEQIKNSQASHQDYKNLTGLDRGHLSPSYHQPTFDGKKATFTLTNIVPQNAKLNGGAWLQYEVQMMINKTEDCTTTYVVVGAVPGNSYISSDRVNVPSYIWSGACCEMGKNQMKAWAVIAENDKNAVQPLTLGQLEDRLTGLYKKGQVSLFHSDCPRQ
ncbi:PREDICTED: endonuclease domain-containing 1 protein-like [Calidris pugnax]|uniref:endonuclease domain-containing 1 protein-like n=1 Tax=Calidris pugnax TaxID=198806 RepID=UPI00071E5728|nr:PREDICTED: endonuclease domain-containing 1 protein-like [Calidris pugnax]